MSPSEFREFIERQKQKKDSSVEIDWQAKKHAWQQAVEGFIQQVKAYLQEFAPDIRCEVESLTLDEEYVGSYQVSYLTIILSDQRIECRPVGMNLIGASGRVDMKGSDGMVKWVLVPETSDKPKVAVQICEQADDSMPEQKDESADLVWKLVTPAPNIRFIPLTKENFLEAIMEVTNG